MIKSPKNSLRYRVHQILETGTRDDVQSRICDFIIIAMILLNVLAYVFGSVDWIATQYKAQLYWFELFSIGFFTIEYLLRIWASVEDIPLRGLPHWKARLSFAMKPLQIIDLISILPFYLGAFIGADLRILRAMRLFRFFKIIRYSPAMQVVIKVFFKEGRALLGALMIMTALILISASGMNYLEGDVQPETFGNIPKAMWWSLATLTTVGFGDAVPVTGLGKIWSGLFMVFGLGMFALPIGILSTGFAQEINRRQFVINWNMVARVPLFNQLKATEVAEIMNLLHAQRFAQDLLIHKKGEIASAMYFIISGQVELDNGKERQELTTGDFFGEAGLLSKSEYQTTARAMSDCELLQLDQDDFEYLLRKNERMDNHIRQVSENRVASD